MSRITFTTEVWQRRCGWMEEPKVTICATTNSLASSSGLAASALFALSVYTIKTMSSPPLHPLILYFYTELYSTFGRAPEFYSYLSVNKQQQYQM